MTSPDDRLVDLLDTRARAVVVAPPPVVAIRSAAGRRVRRTRLVAASTAAAVVTVAALSMTLRGADDPVRPTETQVASTVADPSPDVAPPGTRWIGVGRAVIAVPVGWPVEATRCGLPGARTFVAGDPVADLCRQHDPAGVDSVTIETDVPTPSLDDRRRGEEIEIDGEPALRVRTGTFGLGPATFTARVLLTDLGVSFTAVSTRADGRVRVRQLADTVRVLAQHAVVPEARDPGAATFANLDATTYAQLLRTAGLVPEVDRVGTNEVASVEPEPGTLLPLGTRVTVTTYRYPHG